MDPKKTAVLLSRKLTLYTVVLVPPGGKFKNFHLFSHFSASRGIKSKTVQAAEIRIKFCIFSGQIHVSPCPEHKLSILRHQMKIAVFFGSFWARLGKILILARDQECRGEQDQTALKCQILI